MSKHAAPSTDGDSGAAQSHFLVLLLLLFAGTGCSALVYEIVWYQALELAIGSSAVSLGVLLATFMGGLCLGSLLLPKILPLMPRHWQHPLRTYAAIEILIGIFGIMELAAIPLIGSVYVAGAQSGLPSVLLRSLVTIVTLLPPTMLMGASLPAIVRLFDADKNGAARWGLFYGGNTAGAVFGCLFAAFVLLRHFDVTTATFAAASINFAAAIIALILAPRVVFSPNANARAVAAARGATEQAWTVYLAIGLSGACALGAEVVWTRLMGLMLGGTVYAFAIILAVFLVGLVIGTAVATKLVGSVNPRLALGTCQLFAAFAIAWSAYMIAEALPYWPINPTLSPNAGVTFQLDFVRTFIAILPPALFWGASFPFAFAAVSEGDSDPGRIVGRIYASNTLGAILGALGASLILIPTIGTQQTQRLMLFLSALSALLMLAPYIAKTKSGDAIAYTLAGLIASGLLIWGVAPVPGELIGYGRRMAMNMGQSEMLYTAEGRNTSIGVSRWRDGSIQFHVAGKVEASTMPYDMKLERMLGHLGGLIHENPRSVLVVGFGAGVTAGSFVPYPGVNRILICELEPLIPPTSTRFFEAQNYDVMNDARTEIVYDDARHFVLTTREKFDVITSDPIHPFVKGSATLYSKEYFEMLKAHLNPGGIVTQWIPLYESDAATVKSEIATFFAVFPFATMWANTVDGKGYDLVLVGHLAAPRINIDTAQARLDREDYALVKASLRDVGIARAVDLFGTYLGDTDDLTPWLADAEINYDRDLRLQYLAGLALNNNLEDVIYRAIMRHRQPPGALFVGSEGPMNALNENILRAYLAASNLDE